ncbi:T9SS type A sorting domain-containing protein [Bacteroidota bacterium]
MKSLFIRIVVIALTLYMSNSFLNAKIVYTDINPDTTIAGTNDMPFGTYGMDMNNDGTVDFELKHMNAGGTWLQAEVYSAHGSNNEILVGGGSIPYALDKDEEISPGLNTWINTSSGSVNSALMLGNSWAGNGEHYLAVRFELGGEFYYGWIRMDIPQGEENMTIMDYAYESIAGQSILAGDMGSTGVEEEKYGNYNVYTNSGYLFINRTSQHVSGKTILNIYNLNGIKILSEELKSNESIIDIEKLSAGLYIAVIMDSKEMVSYKFIKK